MLAAKIAEGAHVTAKLVRAVFKQANMPLRCTDGQLRAWVSRTRKNLSELPPKPKKGLTAAEMYAAASSFIGDIAQWRAQPLHKLIMLPNPVFQEDRVCAIWTCPGMLSRAEAAIYASTGELRSRGKRHTVLHCGLRGRLATLQAGPENPGLASAQGLRKGHRGSPAQSLSFRAPV